MPAAALVLSSTMMAEPAMASTRAMNRPSVGRSPRQAQANSSTNTGAMLPSSTLLAVLVLASAAWKKTRSAAKNRPANVPKANCRPLNGRSRAPAPAVATWRAFMARHSA